MSDPGVTAETPVEYQTTRDQCAGQIRGVCPGCGGEVIPFDTVDNAGRPTFWPGCEHCSVFTSGVPASAQTLARLLVEEGTLVPYRIDRDEAHWLERQTNKASYIILRIQHLLAESGRLFPDGGQTVEEWRATGGASPVLVGDEGRTWVTEYVAHRRAAGHPCEAEHRFVTTFPDGSGLTSAWKAVDGDA